jgi:hypothetical protein
MEAAMARKSRYDIPRTLDFEKMIGEGENPKGFTAQTANGTAHWKGTGWNRDYEFTREQVEPAPAWPAGRSNRTGE